MDIIDSIQHLELTYRFAIFGLLVALGLFGTRDYITEIQCRFGGKIEAVSDTFFGVVLFLSFVSVLVGVVRFGVQIIFGV